MKSQTILYWIDPKLPSNKFDYHHTWTIGGKVLRKKGGINVANICVTRAPWVGSSRYITNASYVLDSSMDVIPTQIMKEMVRSAFKGAFKAMDKDEVLPFNIIALRSTGVDGLLTTIFSKELVGIKQVINEFNQDHKDLILKASNGKMNQWNPGLIFTVIQSNVPDYFGAINGNRIDTLTKPVIVANGITSSTYLDAFISIPRKQERDTYAHISRFVTLMDEYNDGRGSIINIGKRGDYLSDFYQLIYASLWGYAYHIPFPKKPNDPAPIKYSMHYAEWLYELILESDEKPEDLAIDIITPKPKMITMVRIDEDREMKMNDFEENYDNKERRDPNNKPLKRRRSSNNNRDSRSRNKRDRSMIDSDPSDTEMRYIKDQRKKPEIVDLVDSD